MASCQVYICSSFEGVLPNEKLVEIGFKTIKNHSLKDPASKTRFKVEKPDNYGKFLTVKERWYDFWSDLFSGVISDNTDDYTDDTCKTTNR